MDHNDSIHQEQPTVRDSAISGDNQGSDRDFQHGSDGPPEPQPNRCPADASNAVPDVMEMRVHPGRTVVEMRSSRRPPPGLPNSIWKFWGRQISVTVPHEACRDHLALERTSLSYLHTSLAFAQLGVIVAQLFRLEHTVSPNPHMGFYVIGAPLASVCYGTAMLLALTGFARFYKQQGAMVRGKIWAGGWELYIIGIIITLILLAVFVLLIVIDISRQR